MSEPPSEDPTLIVTPDQRSAGSQSAVPADPVLVKALRDFGPGYQVFGRFRLLRELGKGGMGVVWLARDERLNLNVALKFLAGMVSADAEALQDLRREITHGLTLTHPGIVRLFDLHEDGDGLAAIAMEYVAGATLTDVKNERADRCFDPPEIEEWVRQLCEVLAYVHEKAKVVHRDLKPRNLMLTAEGELKVTDFGIAATLSDSQSRLTNLRTSGTPAYMSPQQAGGYKPTASDDIYALGATLYELLTSKPPFFRGAGATLLHQLLHEKAPSMNARREELGVSSHPNIPPAWEETVAACLAKEPDDRPATVREVARRLLNGEELVAQTAPEAPRCEENEQTFVTESLPQPVAPPPPVYLPPSRPRPRRRGHFVLSSLLAIGLSVPAGWFVAHRPAGKTSGSGGAVVADPPDQPILRIEAGMHAGEIGRLATDRRGTLVLTISIDKTARLWNPANGKLMQILRPPIGPGREGELISGDLSPDGSIAAVGGMTGLLWDQTASLYLFDTASGRLVRRIKDLPSGISDVAFSPDGKLLAVGFFVGGVHLFEAATGKPIAEDHGFDGAVACVRFSPDGARLAASCHDGQVRLFTTPTLEAAGKPLQRLASEKTSALPARLSFSPNGDYLAVGSGDNAPMEIYSGRDLKFSYSPWKPGARAVNLRTVAWSLDGQTLYAGGMIHTGPLDVFVHIWGAAGHADPTEWVLAAIGISDLHSAAGGRAVFSSFDPTWGTVDPQGHVTTFGKSPIADLRANLLNFSVSGDASVVAFGFQEHGAKPARFSLLERKLTMFGAGETTSSDPRLHTPKVDGLPITGWRNGAKAKLKGEVLATAGGRNRGLAISADNSFFVLAADHQIQGYASDGTLRWAHDWPKLITGLNLSNDGKLVVASFGDGRIRWFSGADGHLLLTLFPHADQERWVVWTPDGYYDTSATGEELVGWHLNQGKDREAAFFPASKYRDKYYRPDIVARALDVTAAASQKPAVEVP